MKGKRAGQTREPNLAQKYPTTGQNTTVMIRNIPNEYTQDELIAEVSEAMGSTDLFDFFYLPWDSQNNCNVGYAFVNFHNNIIAQKAVLVFSKYKFLTHQSAKVGQVSRAHIQGLENNLRHLQDRAVVHGNLPCSPVVVWKGQKIELSAVFQEIRMQDTLKQFTDKAGGNAAASPGSGASTNRLLDRAASHGHSASQSCLGTATVPCAAGTIRAPMSAGFADANHALFADHVLDAVAATAPSSHNGHTVTSADVSTMPPPLAADSGGGGLDDLFEDDEQGLLPPPMHPGSQLVAPISAPPKVGGMTPGAQCYKPPMPAQPGPLTNRFGIQGPVRPMSSRGMRLSTILPSVPDLREGERWDMSTISSDTSNNKLPLLDVPTPSQMAPPGLAEPVRCPDSVDSLSEGPGIRPQLPGPLTGVGLPGSMPGLGPLVSAVATGPALLSTGPERLEVSPMYSPPMAFMEDDYMAQGARTVQDISVQNAQEDVLQKFLEKFG
mmetsp:Transcript_21188/g.49265  ORF Transcript_21188/g.49265 Transcript_21188/m.49265 type:complete len:495 (-) Transcript_21188:102-1586(-)